ncbi:MAG: hypothetical protein ACJ71F_00185 [Nitrososphaeraceae archaeon]
MGLCSSTKENFLLCSKNQVGVCAGGSSNNNRVTKQMTLEKKVKSS